jgi:hypothetical protein
MVETCCAPNAKPSVFSIACGETPSEAAFSRSISTLT